MTSLYIVKWGGWSKTPNFGCFFSFRSTNCVQETTFGKLITSLLNETENPL